MRMKVGLFGLGRTGKVVAQSFMLDERFDVGFAVCNESEERFDFDFPVEPPERISDLLEQFRPDVVVDFTTPEAVMCNIEKLRDETGYVVATTGFSEKQLLKLKANDRLKILYSPNISDGINVMLKACELLNRMWSGTDIEIIEQHFKSKKDSPSGTALEIAKIFDQHVPVHSVRAGGITGVHEVVFAVGSQKITVKHESYSREVFAEGAKKAAEWIVSKRCGFYEICEVYN